MLEAELARLSEQLAAALKNSSTSSKPPSSDIVKPKSAPTSDGQPRRIGGQPGHPLQTRDLFPDEQVTSFHSHQLDACPDCGGAVRPAGGERIVQQVDVVRTPLTIEEHIQPRFWCEHCQKSCLAPLPSGIERGGLVAPI